MSQSDREGRGRPGPGGLTSEGDGLLAGLEAGAPDLRVELSNLTVTLEADYLQGWRSLLDCEAILSGFTLPDIDNNKYSV